MNTLRSILDRTDFDEAVAARFPSARRSRQETRTGWQDTMKVGLLEVVVRVHEVEDRGRPWDAKVGQLDASVLASRDALDGSKTGLWSASGVGWEAAGRVLDQLREELLGLAQGLYQACKGTPADRNDLAQLKKLWDAAPDLSDLFGE
jgi:hypothetical protein